MADSIEEAKKEVLARMDELGVDFYVNAEETIKHINEQGGVDNLTLTNVFKYIKALEDRIMKLSFIPKDKQNG